MKIKRSINKHVRYVCMFNKLVSTFLWILAEKSTNQLLLFYLLLDPNKVQCEVCFKFIHKNTIYRHKKNQHGNSAPVQCSQCERIFKNETSLKDHLRNSHNIYQNNPLELYYLMYIFMFICDTNTLKKCLYFSNILGLCQQQSSPKKIQCEYCEKYFHKDSINRHMKNLHGPSQAWQCQFCNKILKNNDSLKDHQSRVCKLAQK